jgi:rare lipoprotein A (peptidoglycan hydrolase)
VGNTAWVVVNDRGPYIGARDLDLSQGVAQQLGLIETSVDYVEVTYLGGSQAVEVPQSPVIDSPAAVVDPPLGDERHTGVGPQRILRGADGR